MYSTSTSTFSSRPVRISCVCDKYATDADEWWWNAHETLSFMRYGMRTTCNINMHCGICYTLLYLCLFLWRATGIRAARWTRARIVITVCLRHHSCFCHMSMDDAAHFSSVLHIMQREIKVVADASSIVWSSHFCPSFYILQTRKRSRKKSKELFNITEIYLWKYITLFLWLHDGYPNHAYHSDRRKDVASNKNTNFCPFHSRSFCDRLWVFVPILRNSIFCCLYLPTFRIFHAHSIFYGYENAAFHNIKIMYDGLF